MFASFLIHMLAHMVKRCCVGQKNEVMVSTMCACEAISVILFFSWICIFGLLPNILGFWD